MIKLSEDNTFPLILYHKVTERSYEYVKENGITPDRDGFVYLSMYPVPLGYNEYTHNFQVRIPNPELLYDWRDFWQEDGEDIDMYHEWDPENPSYIYMGKIPITYIKEV